MAQTDVMDYETGSKLDGTPSPELVAKSASTGYGGAVAAYRDSAGVWQYVREDAVDHYTRNLRETVVTVYVL